MKKLFYSAGIGSIMLLLAVIVQSCKQDVVNQPTPTVDNATTTPTSVSALKLDNVEVIDGRLAFKSQNDLKAAYEKMFKNQSDLKDFEAQFKGFTSQKQAFERFTEEDLKRTNGDLTPFKDYVTENTRDGEVHCDRVVGPKLYSHLVSAEGLLQVGNKVYKFVPGFVYEFGINDMSSYLANKNSLSAIPNVQKIDFEFKKQRIQATSREPQFESGQKTDVYELSNGYQYRKVDAYLTTPNPCCFFAWGAEIILEHRKRGSFGRWYGERTDMRFSGTVSYGVIEYNGTQTKFPLLTVNNIGPNNSEISSLLSYNYDGFEYVYFSPTSVDYRVVKQPGQNPWTFSNLNITF